MHILYHMISVYITYKHIKLLHQTLYTYCLPFPFNALPRMVQLLGWQGNLKPAKSPPATF